MRKPEESLEDFTVKAIAIEKASEPARVASLRFRGQVEVLRPLASWDGPADAGPPVSRLPWFQRSLAVVGGLAVIALMFLSAIFFGMYDQPAEPSVGLSDPATDHGPMRTERPLKPDIFAAQNSTPAGDELPQVRSIVKPRSERPRVQVAAYRPRRQSRRPPVVPRFVPTTLVIYAENGEIKKRIEPRLSAVYKKPLTITN
jgi:hypothetical protein